MKNINSAIRHHLLNICGLMFILIGFSISISAQRPSETPPPPSEPPTLTIPEVKEMTLPNGLKVVVVPKTDVPLVTVSLLIKNGANSETARQAGLANMTANLLLKGTEFRNSTEIAEQIDFLGGSLNSYADWESTNVNLTVMKDKLGRALSIMSDSVIRPIFPADEITLAKKQTLDGFNVSLKEPGTVLTYVATRYSFDEHNPIGTPQTVSGLNRNVITKFHNEMYVPATSVLIFTGDITEQQAFGFAKLFFGGWQNSMPNKVSKDNENNTESNSSAKNKSQTINRFLVVDLPNSGQAAVGYAVKLIDGRIICESEDTINNKCLTSSVFYPATVLNSVLGGGYSARLNQEIRLKRGLSYGAGSGFDWRGLNTNFNATTQTKNESAAEVAELIKIEIDKLVNDSITDDEINPRKAVVTGSFGRALQTNSGLANSLRDLYLYNIDPNELNTYMNNVSKVNDSQIKSFASDNLRGGDMIIVGDAKMFMDDLKKRFPNQKFEIIKASNLDLNKDNLKRK